MRKITLLIFLSSILFGCYGSYDPIILSHEAFILNSSLTRLLLEKPIQFSAALEGICMQLPKNYIISKAGTEITDPRNNKIMPLVKIITISNREILLNERSSISSTNEVCFINVTENTANESFRAIEITSNSMLPTEKISWYKLSK